MAVQVFVITECTDAWFETDGRGTRLLVAVGPDVEPPGAGEFRMRLAGGGFLHFRHVADLKARRVFEAMQWRPEDDRGPPSEVPTHQLAGPFRRGSADVA